MIDDQHEDTREIRRLLDDRVASLRPDLAGRASRAIAVGRRMRRRRRLAATSAGVAGVAAVGIVGVQVAGTPHASSPSPAPAASDGATAAPKCLTQADAVRLKKSLALREDLAWKKAELERVTALEKVRGRHTKDQARKTAELERVTALEKIRGRGKKGAESKELQSLEARIARDSAHSSHLRIDLCGTGVGSSQPPEKLPVALKAPGWTCQPPADEKFVCTSGSESALVVVRPAAYREDYRTDPDKATPGQYVSSVHGDVFATIESKTTGVADRLAPYLVWR